MSEYSDYLYGAPGAGAAADEVPQVGRENALQDPLLVVPRHSARPVAAHHAARWKEKKGQETLLCKLGHKSKVQKFNIKRFYLWLTSEWIQRKSI